MPTECGVMREMPVRRVLFCSDASSLAALRGDSFRCRRSSGCGVASRVVTRSHDWKVLVTQEAWWA